MSDQGIQAQVRVGATVVVAGGHRAEVLEVDGDLLRLRYLDRPGIFWLRREKVKVVDDATPHQQ